jgi:hypothetical protein
MYYSQVMIELGITFAIHYWLGVRSSGGQLPKDLMAELVLIQE